MATAVATTLAVAAGMLGVAFSGSASAGDHFYCPSVAGGPGVCNSTITHTYGRNNVAYAGPSLSWCEMLMLSGEYSRRCISGAGGGYTLYGEWIDWCLPNCGWRENNSTDLADWVVNNGSSTHSFNAHSYW